jgi:hypothetical protein
MRVCREHQQNCDEICLLLLAGLRMVVFGGSACNSETLDLLFAWAGCTQRTLQGHIDHDKGDITPS